MNLINISRTVVDDFIRFSIVINHNGNKIERYIEAPNNIKYNHLDDAMLLLSYPDIMTLGGKYHFKGRVSSGLLYNLTQYNAFWNNLLPNRFYKVEIEVDEEVFVSRSNNKNAISMFSSSMDASYSLLRHTQKLAGVRNLNLTTSLLIHGCDIPLERQDQYKKPLKKLSKPVKY